MKHLKLSFLLTCNFMAAMVLNAMDIQFVGSVEDSSQWQEPLEALGAVRASVKGYAFFGPSSSAGAEDFIDKMRLPNYVTSVKVEPGVEGYQNANYKQIEDFKNPAQQWLSGTLTRRANIPSDLVRIKLGAGVPSALRLAVLTDNLDSPAYTPEAIRLVAGSAENAVLVNGGALAANSQPDWYMWNISGAKPGDEIVVRVSPSSGVATLGGLVFLTPEDATSMNHIGEFSREGEYIKDYYVFKKADTYHLFYNVGLASATQDWQEPENEKAFGHATSKDFNNWTHHPRVLHVIPGSWEGQVVSAPSIIEHAGMYYMIYSGFDDRVRGLQTIGLAWSEDLFTWERYEGNPVYTAPAWARGESPGWVDCRDAHIIRYKDEFLLFTMVTTNENQGAISVASSSDMKNWKDLGPALITFREPESPRVFEHNGVYYMFATSGHGRILLKTTEPKTINWEEIPFNWPAPGLWSGWEVLQEEGRTIFSAFEWKMHGNYIRFWEVDWDGDLPVVRY